MRNLEVVESLKFTIFGAVTKKKIKTTISCSFNNKKDI